MPAKIKTKPMVNFLIRSAKIGKTWFVLAVAVLLGLSMSLFSSAVYIIIEDNSGWERFYSASALGMFAGGFIGGLFVGIALWYLIKSKNNK